MNGKKIAVLSALVLVVLGCIFAAGCTDAGSTPAAEKTTGIVGTWIPDIKFVENSLKQAGKLLGAADEYLVGNLTTLPDSMNYSYQINAEGTGTYSILGTSSPLTWKSLGDNKYAVTTEGHESTFIYDSVTDRIIEDADMSPLPLVRKA
ncbi:MAG TPA: hypothetical protein O0X27_03495 [Methanocorpusculum sp.]|nr:hypothetical protein [Methanocorpusculum sp.]